METKTEIQFKEFNYTQKKAIKIRKMGMIRLYAQNYDTISTEIVVNAEKQKNI